MTTMIERAAISVYWSALAFATLQLVSFLNDDFDLFRIDGHERRLTAIFAVLFFGWLVRFVLTGNRSIMPCNINRAAVRIAAIVIAICAMVGVATSLDPRLGAGVIIFVIACFIAWLRDPTRQKKQPQEGT